MYEYVLSEFVFLVLNFVFGGFNINWREFGVFFVFFLLLNFVDCFMVGELDFDLFFDKVFIIGDFLRGGEFLDFCELDNGLLEELFWFELDFEFLLF